MTSRVFSHIRARLARGLLLVLPLLITVWLLRFLFGLINDNITPWVVLLIRASGVPDLDRLPTRMVVPVIGLVLTTLFIYLLGLLAGNLASRRIWSWIETGILRIPLVKGIYGAARQLLDALSVTSRGKFSKVVLVEYPRPGLWTIGFVTNDAEHRVGRAGSASPSVAVFLPTTPNPTSGWVVLVPREDLMVLNVSVEEGIKLVVSGGIVMPDDFGARLRPWEVGTESTPRR